MKPKDLLEMLKETFWQWYEDKTSRLGAALAYYTAFSLAPMLVIAIAIASFVFGEKAARGEVAKELEKTVGPRIGGAIEELIQQAHATGSGTIATVVGVVVLLFSATAVFGQLQDGLNTIWGVQPKAGRGVLGVIKDRFWSFLAVLGIGFLLLASLLASSVLAALDKFLHPHLLPGGVYLWQALEVVVSLGLVTLLFAMIYKLLPDVEIAWRDVWVGAAVTAVLFTLGTYLIGLYLGRSGVASTYGAAGSLVIILLWVYYSSQILLFGAEFTQVYANKYGRPLVRGDKAEPMTAEARARQGIPATKNGAATPAKSV